MITTQDKELLAKKGITEAQIAEQLACLQTGFPFLKLDAAASIEKGILAPDAEEQKEIAGLFNAKIHEVETKQDKEKALKETIERIKENSIDVRRRQSEPNDLTVVMQLINEQKELEKRKKTHISID